MKHNKIAAADYRENEDVQETLSRSAWWEGEIEVLWWRSHREIHLINPIRMAVQLSLPADTNQEVSWNSLF